MITRVEDGDSSQPRFPKENQGQRLFWFPSLRSRSFQPQNELVRSGCICDRILGVD